MNIEITEFKEPTKVEISSVECKSCRLIHSLDGDGNCEFCRRRLASPPKTTWELVKGLFENDKVTT